jgi:Domain of unknown function (DUF1905)
LITPSDFFADEDDAAPAEVAVTGPVWKWRAADPTKTAAWYFITIAGQAAADVRTASLGRTGGFGSIRVTAQIGRTRWQTSLFPAKEQGGYLLPIKADVRRKEGIEEAAEVEVTLIV